MTTSRLILRWFVEFYRSGTFWLILAGEAIFLLPFVLPRIFRKTVLDVFQADNVMLGDWFKWYGIVAMGSYLLGGPVADLFPPRKLMSLALIATAIGGFYMATFPPDSEMRLLYAYWGFTTIFLFWAALLKATRQTGGATKQGRAFGFLEGGRGLVSALMGTFGVSLFALMMPANETGVEVTLEESRSAYRVVILATSGLVALVGILIWNFLNVDSQEEPISEPPPHRLGPGLGRLAWIAALWPALSRPPVWMLMLIVLCGYVGYKTTDDFSLYASEVMNFNSVNAAMLGTGLLYFRPIVGVFAGLMADWSRASTWLVAGFLFMLVGSVLIASGAIRPGGYAMFAISMLTTCVGVYAIRSLYFAALQEGRIPLSVTGTAIGLISVVGYTPDIFMGPVMGEILEASPGAEGHQNLFWFLAVFSGAGLIAAIVFWMNARRAAT